MNVAFRIVSKPNADFDSLCGLAYSATNKKISSHADGHSPKLTPDRKLASCLATFIEHNPEAFTPLVLHHLHFSGFLLVQDHLVPLVMMHAAGLACLSTSTHTRGLSAVILSGNLNSWRDAAYAFFSSSDPDNVDIHAVADAVMACFRAEGYGEVFTPPNNNGQRGLIKR